MMLQLHRRTKQAVEQADALQLDSDSKSALDGLWELRVVMWGAFTVREASR